MPYTVTASGDPDENGVYPKFFCTVTLDAYPGQAVETEFPNVTQAGAEEAGQALEEQVAANPAQYFGG